MPKYAVTAVFAVEGDDASDAARVVLYGLCDEWEIWIDDVKSLDTDDSEA